jgi:hypothetical protein
MAQVTGQAQETGDVTRGERIAAIAGIACGLIILVVCIDLASGGKIGTALSRRDAAALGLKDDGGPGGCPGGCP